VKQGSSYPRLSPEWLSRQGARAQNAIRRSLKDQLEKIIDKVQKELDALKKPAPAEG
jgi:hypothetical protein